MYRICMYVYACVGVNDVIITKWIHLDFENFFVDPPMKSFGGTPRPPHEKYGEVPPMKNLIRPPSMKNFGEPPPQYYQVLTMA